MDLGAVIRRLSTCRGASNVKHRAVGLLKVMTIALIPRWFSDRDGSEVFVRQRRE